MPTMEDYIRANLFPTAGGHINDRLRAYLSRIYVDEGAPEGVVTAPVGSEYTDLSNGAKYMKTAGSGSTGWSALAGGAATPTNGSVGVTTQLYISTTGNDNNAGTAGAPFATLQRAFDEITTRSVFGPLAGTFRINYAAGTYTETLANFTYLPAHTRIQIKGARDGSNVPTVILDGESQANLYAMQFSMCSFVYVEDVMLVNFTGTNGNGIIAQFFSNIHTKNVWADNIGFAALNIVMSKLYQEGGAGRGKITDCRYGVRGYTACEITVGHNATDPAVDGPWFLNCTDAAVLCRDSSNGHVDYATIDNCVKGVHIFNNARLHVLGSDIKNNTTAGIRCEAGGRVNDDATTVNTYTNNGEDLQLFSFSTEENRQGNDRNPPLGKYLDLTSGPAHTGTTNETDLRTGYTLPANRLFKTGQKMIIRTSGKFDGPGQKTLRIRFDTSTVIGLSVTPTVLKAFYFEVVVFPTAINVQKCEGFLLCDGITPEVDNQARAAVMSSDRTVKLQGTLADAAGSITVERYEIEMID